MKRGGFRENTAGGGGGGQPGKGGLGEGDARQRMARPGDPRVWNLGSQVGGKQGRAVNTSGFYLSGQ